MLPKLNKSTTGWREIPEEKGGGVAGLLEGFHQIHCLVTNPFLISQSERPRFESQTDIEVIESDSAVYIPR